MGEDVRRSGAVATRAAGERRTHQSLAWKEDDWGKALRLGKVGIVFGLRLTIASCVLGCHNIQKQFCFAQPIIFLKTFSSQIFSLMTNTVKYSYKGYYSNAPLMMG